MAMNTNIKSVLGDFLNAYDEITTIYYDNTLGVGLRELQDLHEVYLNTLDRLEEDFVSKILDVYIKTLKQL